jgi:hypothetical protein
VQELCALGLTINPNFDFALLGDCLLMFDKTKYQPNISPVVRACTKSRLFDGNNCSEQELAQCEFDIMHNSKPEEKAFIKHLYNLLTNYKDPVFHHDLWYGLVCMGQNNWTEAKTALAKVGVRKQYFNKKREEDNKLLCYNPERIQNYIKIVEQHA